MKSLINSKVAIFLGGPSNERNISLDSSRTFFDSIRKTVNEKNIDLIFVSIDNEFYKLNPDYIYSNTIEDFEYKILKEPKLRLNEIINSYDTLCPIIHGKFGEDGELTKLFENAGKKCFLGSSSEALALTLNKAASIEKLKELGYKNVSYKLINYNDWQKNKSTIIANIEKYIPSYKNGYRIVKPNDCGSSDGVSLVNINNLGIAISKASEYSHQILIEEKIEGREFSLIILQDIDGHIVPLLPTEIKFTDFTKTLTSGIYSRQKKYMPGTGAEHITPMLTEKKIIKKIRTEAKNIFKSFGMSDWARFDGFLTKNNDIIWSDLNGSPGYGQDSFLFQQASLFGFDHLSVSILLLLRSLNKENNNFIYEDERHKKRKVKIAVIGGGTTSERHVSRMSWLNVIQKLKAIKKYEIINIFQDSNGNYWNVPYFAALQHTVEEIESILNNPQHYQQSLLLSEEIKKSMSNNFEKLSTSYINFLPHKMDLKTIANKADFIFICLHGGKGEDGTLQKELETLRIPYNGCDSYASNICMNKYITNQKINQFSIKGFTGPKQELINLHEINNLLSNNEFTLDDLNYLLRIINEGECIDKLKKSKRFIKFNEIINNFIENIQNRLNSTDGLVFKPIDDGCSSGVIVSRNPKMEIPVYLLYLQSNLDKIPFYSLYNNFDKNSEQFLQMPTEKVSQILAEQFLGKKVSNGDNEFIEMTIGVIGNKEKMISLLPSETPSLFGILTVEEKFCKGIGTNLTPPPSLNDSLVKSIQERVLEFSNKIGLNGYSRIDIIYNKKHDHMYLLEVNTLPGLTPATIIYTQALLTPSIRLKPAEFIDRIIEEGLIYWK